MPLTVRLSRFQPISDDIAGPEAFFAHARFSDERQYRIRWAKIAPPKRVGHNGDPVDGYHLTVWAKRGPETGKGSYDEPVRLGLDRREVLIAAVQEAVKNARMVQSGVEKAREPARASRVAVDSPEPGKLPSDVQRALVAAYGTARDLGPEAVRLLRQLRAAPRNPQVWAEVQRLLRRADSLERPKEYEITGRGERVFAFSPREAAQRYAFDIMPHLGLMPEDVEMEIREVRG